MSSDTFLWRLMVPEVANGEGVRYMDWARILGYVTGTVDQELLARNEYLVTENLSLLKNQFSWVGTRSVPPRQSHAARRS
jgi:hypothetical protein